MSFAELQNRNMEKYGKDGWMIKLKFLITKILEKESGDFDFIMRKLCKKEEIDCSDVLKSRVLVVLKNWKGLKKEQKKSGNRIERYSLE